MYGGQSLKPKKSKIPFSSWRGRWIAHKSGRLLVNNNTLLWNLIRTGSQHPTGWLSVLQCGKKNLPLDSLLRQSSHCLMKKEGCLLPCLSVWCYGSRYTRLNICSDCLLSTCQAKLIFPGDSCDWFEASSVWSGSFHGLRAGPGGKVCR